MNVLMVSKGDYAGSGYEIRCAVNKYTKHHVELAVNKIHRFGYKYDLLIGDTKKFELALDWADLIHFKGDEIPGLEPFKVQIPHDKPWLITVSGSLCRRRRPWNEERIALEWWQLEEYEVFDRVVSLTPDLNYPELNSQWIPHCINTNKFKNCWKDREPVVIGHSPSNRRKKGTDRLLIPVVEQLKREGFEVELDIIYRVSHSECLRRKKRCSLFFDQALAGFYGRSAVEAMAYGIPTVALICQDAIIQGGELISLCPVLRMEAPTPDEMYRVLRSYLEMSSLERGELSIRSRAWVEMFHDYRYAAREYDKIYREMI